MIHLRFVRYGIASAMAIAGLGMLASCVSGVVDTNGGSGQAVGSGGQGNAATGNTGVSTGGSLTGSGGTIASGGKGGGASTTGGTSAIGGASAIGGMPAGGTQGQAGSATTGGGGASAGAGSGGKGAAGTTGMAGTMGMAGTSSGPQPLPPITGGTQGYSTRFWDCCKPSCSNSRDSCNSSGTASDTGASACTGGSSFMCYSFAPFPDAANPYVSYAFAASTLGGCGSCWEVQFTGASGCGSPTSCPSHAATGLAFKTLFVQVINTGSDLVGNQFDLLIPGGGVGLFNACSRQWAPFSNLGPTSGGFLAACNGSATCTQSTCNSAFSGKPDLLAGCTWFVNWFTAADNPQITYKPVACPSQLSSKSGM